MPIIHLEQFCITPLRSVKNAFDGYRKVSDRTSQQENLSIPPNSNLKDGNNKALPGLSLPRARLIYMIGLTFLLFGIFPAKADLPSLATGVDYWVGYINGTETCAATTRLAAASCIAEAFCPPDSHTVTCDTGLDAQTWCAGRPISNYCTMLMAHPDNGNAPNCLGCVLSY